MVAAKAYFFDGKNKLVAQAKLAEAGKKNDRGYTAPVLMHGNEGVNLYFAIPEKVRNMTWKAVVVFGDKHEAKSICYPPTERDFFLEYPEKKLVYDRTPKRVVRKAAMDPLIEHVVKTRNPEMPQITLFLRPPPGIADASEIKGVMAICVLAGSVDEIKREMQKPELSGDYNGLFAFANRNKLAIISWGSRRLWDPGRNFDELPKEEAKKIDNSLDTVAAAWTRGVEELAGKYDLPKSNYLLWGNCGSAQWAQRLCLRRPEFFLATYIHMPGSYDKPTPEAANVLWCLTIGELEGGYERSKRWVKAARELGYPIIYKAIPGLGHASHPDAIALSFEFYEFALSQKVAREEYEATRASSLSEALRADGARKPWSELFQEPPFYGDMVNQELFPSDQVGMIPPGFRISLPTKKIADVWARSK